MPEQANEFVLDLGDNGRHVFGSSDELRDWLAQEVKFWENTPVHPRYWQLEDQFQRSVTNTKQLAKQWGEWEQRLRDEFSQLVHSGSARGRFVAELRKKGGGDQASGAAMYFMNLLHPHPSGKTMRGTLAAHAFESGSVEGTKTLAEDLLRLRTELDSAVSQAKSAISDLTAQTARAKQESTDWQDASRAALQAEAATARNEVKSQAATFASQLHAVVGSLNQTASTEVMAAKKMLEDAAERVRSAMELARQELDNFRKTMLNEIALRAPIDYWSNRKRYHFWSAWAFAILSLAAFVGAGIGVKVFVDNYLPIEALFDWPHLPLGWMVFAGVVITLGLWLLRTLVRLFVSHQHLSTDARERVALIQTYLALLKEGATTQQDRSLALQAIFRTAVVAPPREANSVPSLVSQKP